jgi:group I intron endonuclease
MTRVISGIYRIVHRESGRCYVGQTSNVGRRWAEHRSLLKLGKHKSRRFQNIWDKYGREAFEWELLEECPPEKLTEAEQFWMDLLRPVLNHAPAAGSTLGMKRPDVSLAKKGVPRSAETRAKIAATWTPERRAAWAEHKRGSVQSAEARAKISAAHTGMRKPWMDGNELGKLTTGYRRTAEQRERVSKSRFGNKNCVGRVLSDETKAKIAAAPRTEEMKAKMRAAWTPERRAAMAARNKANPPQWSEASRAKASASHTGVAKPLTPEGHARVAAANRRRFARTRPLTGSGETAGSTSQG